MYVRIIKFLEINNCISPLQFGFRKHHSTNDTLISIAENISKALDSGKFACGIFVDLNSIKGFLPLILLIIKSC